MNERPLLTLSAAVDATFEAVDPQRWDDYEYVVGSFEMILRRTGRQLAVVRI